MDDGPGGDAGSDPNVLDVDLPGAFAYRYADLPDGVDASTFETRVGSCYTLAAHGQANLRSRGWRDVTLVHGIIGPLGNPHAWLEFRVAGQRLVWDPTLDEVLRWQWYRDEWKARVWSRYTIQQAAANLLREEHFGPWGANDARYDRRLEAMEKIKAANRRP